MPGQSSAARTAPHSRPRCPKCSGQIYLEQDSDTRFVLPPEWTCLQCGWRRSFTPRQFERAFALSTGVDDEDLAVVPA